MKIRSSSLGFTLFEQLIVVAIVGILASCSYLIFTKVGSSTKQQKLESDVAVLNNAINIFEASGGNLTGLASPEDVLARLRSTALASEADRLPGFSSSAIDPRIAIEPMTDREALRRGNQRAVWNGDKRRFRIATAGPGIKRFYLDDKVAEAAAEEISRASVVQYAAESTWVWDYQDRASSGPSGPTVVATTSVPNTLPPASTPPPVTPPPYVPPAVADLNPPLFSIPGGSYGIEDYDLNLTLMNPNPGGASDIFYSVNYGTWERYIGPITTVPGMVVSAQTVSLDPGRYRDSSKIDNNYEATPTTLLPPVITTDNSSFGVVDIYDIGVSLSNPNDPAISDTLYRLNGGLWLPYSGPFVLSKTDYPDGVTIEAQSISAGSPYYFPSIVSRSNIDKILLDLSGSTMGAFYNPTGPLGMKSNLNGGNSSSYFEWGNGEGHGRSKSTLDYTGASFADIPEGVRFNAGLLSYRNGTIKSGSGADTIDLDIELSLNINGAIFNPFFGFTFDLINTPNDASDPWGSADYVQLSDAISNRTLVVNGYEFEFLLEFGETTDFGFSQFDQFHVLENETASVQLYGTLVGIGRVSDPSDPNSGGSADYGDGKTLQDVLAEAASTGLLDIGQRDDYVDSVQYSKALVGSAKDSLNIAKDSRDIAELNFEATEKATKDFESKLAAEKYIEAEILQTASTNGAIAAEEAAQTAEGAASLAEIAANAAEAAVAIGIAADDPKVSDLQKKAGEANKAATEAAILAAEARAFANQATADAVSVSIAWDDSLANGPTNDPEGFTEYLSKSTELASDTAKDQVKVAKDFADDAEKAVEDVEKKIDEGKYDDARKIADAGTAAAIAAEAAAQIAEDAAAAAEAAAILAASIASANPLEDIIKDAEDAADSALDAREYADEVRIEADAANDFAMQIAALLTLIP